MGKWEYLNVTYKCGLFKSGPDEVTKFCNEYGELGWEMVNFVFAGDLNLMCFMFKRKKTD